MPDCAHTNNRVVDSRDSFTGLRRRRECTDCKHRWTTVEVSVGATSRGRSPIGLMTSQIKKATYLEMSERLARMAAALVEVDDGDAPDDEVF